MAVFRDAPSITASKRVRVLVPGGITSTGEIPGLTTANQGDRAMLVAVQYALEDLEGASLSELWRGVWYCVGDTLHVDAIYLTEQYTDIPSENFHFLRVLESVEIPRDLDVPVELKPEDQPDEDVGQKKKKKSKAQKEREAALHALKQALAEYDKQPRPRRLDIQVGAIMRVPRSPEGQSANIGHAEYHFNETQAVSSERGRVRSPSQDGSNFVSYMHTRGRRKLYVAMDRSLRPALFGGNSQAVKFVHARLAEDLDNLGNERRAELDKTDKAENPTQTVVGEQSRRVSGRLRMADALSYTVLCRDLLLMAENSESRVAACFSVEGCVGTRLLEAYKSAYMILQNFADLLGAGPEAAGWVFYRWHQKMYTVARILNLPVRISGHVLINNPDWSHLYQFGLAAPIIHLNDGQSREIWAPSPCPALGFSTSSGHFNNPAIEWVLLPAERVQPGTYAANRYPVKTKGRGDTFILHTLGWYEQSDGHRAGEEGTSADCRAKMIELTHAAGTDKRRAEAEAIAAAIDAGTQDIAPVLHDACFAVVTS